MCLCRFTGVVVARGEVRNGGLHVLAGVASRNKCLGRFGPND